MISFEKPAGWKVLELGCGANPHPLSDVRVDVRAVPGITHFECNFNAPEWPEIGSEGFEIVLGIFVLEHISWRNFPNALREIKRILKPGGKAIFVVPNTEAQLKWIEKRGWEKKDKNDGSFIEASRVIFGDLDYPENSHKLFLSPSIVMKAFSEAGFLNVTTIPFGELQTDMIIEASKEGEIPPPTPTPGLPSLPPQKVEFGTIPPILQSAQDESKKISPSTLAPIQEVSKEEISKEEISKEEIREPQKSIPSSTSERVDPSSIYNRDYFNAYQGGGFAWDYPTNEVLARKVLERNPSSVLELGCARGYILKRIQDAGIRAQGLDVSNHAWLTRVCDPINKVDLTKENWPIGKKEFDLAFSSSLLEHIPEDRLEIFMRELERVSARGLHSITVEGGEQSKDKTRCTLKPLDFWRRILPPNHEVVDCREFGNGKIPDEYVKGDGRLKLNIGCAWTQFHNGWTNIDIMDVNSFSNPFQYKFLQCDVRNGLPSISTGIVDLIFSSHMLEHLSYEEGLRFLRECRRIIRPSGGLRLVLPDADLLIVKYYHDLLGEFDEVNEACAKSQSRAGKLWSLLGEGHRAFYNKDTLASLLRESGWIPYPTTFRSAVVAANEQTLREGIEISYGFSLFMDAAPA